MKRNDLNAIITGIVHRYIEDGWVLEMYGWKNVRPSDVVIAKETCAEGIYYRVRKTVGNGDFFSVTSFGKR